MTTEEILEHLPEKFKMTSIGSTFLRFMHYVNQD
jgi:hypothetical protein